MKDTFKIGECETCPSKDIEISLHYGNMWMCAVCWDKEQAFQKVNQSLENQQKRVNEYLEKSRAIDSQIETKTDIFNAATIPAVELKTAILNDENIAPKDRDGKYADECMMRFLNLKRAIFEDREALQKKENEMRMWQVQVRTVAHQLSEKYREEFKQLNISYQPVKPKSVKPAAAKTPKKFQKEEVNTMAAKYGVPAPAVQMLVVAKNMTPEDAAKLLSSSIAGVKS